MSSGGDWWTDGGRRGYRTTSRESWSGNRGVWRGSRGGFTSEWGNTGRGFHPPLEPQNWTLGPALDSIELDQLLLDKEPSAIRSVRYAASYSWLDSDKPMVAVPGSPPFWNPPYDSDSALEQDRGDFYRDPNAARFPAYPTEPAARSLLTQDSGVDLGSIDIMACASTLGNLLRFSRSIPSVFRFDAELIGDTIFLVRKENSPTELIKDVKGYGHTFPKAYTKWDEGLEKSVSHQRIVNYDFGGLQCLVRFGCDGYIKNPSLTSPPTPAMASSDPLPPPSPTAGLPVPGQKLRVESKGQYVAQDFIFDIKTRHVAHKIDMEDMLPRLWITQTPGFLEANYEKPGEFFEPQIRNVKQEVDAWERKNAAALSRFHAVLMRIRDVVKKADRGCVEVSWKYPGPLRLTQVLQKDGKVRHALPMDLTEQWRAKLDG